jgi:long-chain acyl-CoA synthetase
MTLNTVLSEKADTASDRVFLLFKTEKLTFSDVEKRVALTSGGLRKLGFSVQDRAAILMGNCPGYIVSYFAILRAGGIAIPLNTFLTPEEVSTP